MKRGIKCKICNNDEWVKINHTNMLKKSNHSYSYQCCLICGYQCDYKPIDKEGKEIK